jgi:hypothetical protein
LYKNIQNKKNRTEELKKKTRCGQTNIKDEMGTFVFDVDSCEPCINIIRKISNARREL